MWVAETAAKVVGFGLIQGEPPSGELAALFVGPSAISTGCGRRLLRHILREDAERGFTRVHLNADPGAAPFYLHFGAVRLGSTPSGSIPGRVLPHLEFRLDSSGNSSSAS